MKTKNILEKLIKEYVDTILLSEAPVISAYSRAGGGGGEDLWADLFLQNLKKNNVKKSPELLKWVQYAIDNFEDVPEYVAAKHADPIDSAVVRKAILDTRKDMEARKSSFHAGGGTHDPYSAPPAKKSSLTEDEKKKIISDIRKTAHGEHNPTNIEPFYEVFYNVLVLGAGTRKLRFIVGYSSMPTGGFVFVQAHMSIDLDIPNARMSLTREDIYDKWTNEVIMLYLDNLDIWEKIAPMYLP